MEREHLGSRLGFILLSAGCAIGIGNVWKFPWMAGQYGGGMFVLIYLLFLALIGVPVLTMEFAMGRASQKSPTQMYQQLEKKGHKWHIHGVVSMIGGYVLMMFYTVVSGWLLYYFVSTATGKFEGLDTAGVGAAFTEMQSKPVSMSVYMAVVVILGVLVCSFGVQKGLERVTKYLMLALLAIMVVLAVNSVTMDGGKEGLEFYLVPSIDRMKEAGIGAVIAGALSQSFFTLSLGIGCMAVFGSYIKKDRSLLGEAVSVSLLDTFVAFTSGLIIFPACFAYGVNPDSGPNLIFVTLPNIFNHVSMGRLWGSLFFVFMSFAAMSTIFTVFEMIIACNMDLLKWSRKKACIVNAVLLFVLSMPCVLGFNVLSNVKLGGLDIMGMEDYVVSNVLLPVGSLIFIVFCVTRYGWGWDKFVAEANEGRGLKVANWMRPYMTYVLPIAVLVIIFMCLGILKF